MTRAVHPLRVQQSAQLKMWVSTRHIPFMLASRGSRARGRIALETKRFGLFLNVHQSAMLRTALFTHRLESSRLSRQPILLIKPFSSSFCKLSRVVKKKRAWASVLWGKRVFCDEKTFVLKFSVFDSVTCRNALGAFFVLALYQEATFYVELGIPSTVASLFHSNYCRARLRRRKAIFGVWRKSCDKCKRGWRATKKGLTESVNELTRDDSAQGRSWRVILIWRRWVTDRLELEVLPGHWSDTGGVAMPLSNLGVLGHERPEGVARPRTLRGSARPLNAQRHRLLKKKIPRASIHKQLFRNFQIFWKGPELIRSENRHEQSNSMTFQEFWRRNRLHQAIHYRSSAALHISLSFEATSLDRVVSQPKPKLFLASCPHSAKPDTVDAS